MGSINTYVNFELPESIGKGNRTSVSNFLYSVKQYNGRHQAEINIRRDI